MRLHVLHIATRFNTNLPKYLLEDRWGAGLAADLGRVLFEPLAEYITVVGDLNARGFVPDGFLEEVGQGGVCLPRLPQDMASAMGHVSAHYLDICKLRHLQDLTH